MTAPWSAASIRVRLTGWYTVVLSLMLVVYATATFVAVRHEFFEQLDDQIHDDFESAEGLLRPAPDGRVVWAGDRRAIPTTTRIAAAKSGRPPVTRFIVPAPPRHGRPSRRRRSAVRPDTSRWCPAGIPGGP